MSVMKENKDIALVCPNKLMYNEPHQFRATRPEPIRSGMDGFAARNKQEELL